MDRTWGRKTKKQLSEGIKLDFQGNHARQSKFPYYPPSPTASPDSTPENQKIASSRKGMAMSRVQPSLPLTVLIVEDEPFLRLDVASSFAKAGWTVIEAASGEEAVHFAGNGDHIDVVFTDIRLRGKLTGWDVGEVFREADATMPIVYASGLPELPMRQVPGSIYFDKPYDNTQILGACEKLLRY